MSLSATAATELFQRQQSRLRGDWWRCLFDQSEDAQIICAPNGSIVEINPRAAHLFGLSQDHWPECSLSQILTAAATQKVLGLLARPRSQPENLLGLSLLSEGRLNSIADLLVTPLSEGYSVLTIKDATRRWRLESHAQRLMAAMDATLDLVYLTDEKFRLTYTNASFQSVTGFTIEDALGRTADFLRHESCQTKIKEYTETVRRGADWTGELLNRKRDGALYPVEAAISPIYNNKGEFIGSVSFERDQTARKKLQEDLLLERNFVRSILNSLESAVYTIDRQFRLTHFNEGWKKMPAAHGCLRLDTPPEAGRCLLEYVPDPAKRVELEALFETVLREGTARELRVANLNWTWLIHVFPWRHEEEIRGIIYKVTDHTQHTVLQNQLYQSQKMETIGALAAGVAHDFNNFLLAIRGNVNLLMLEPEMPAATQTRLKQIEDAANQASAITQQLLSFSRSSDEQLIILDFNQTIAEVGEMARRSARGKVDIRVEPAPEPVKVRIDGTRAQQCLLNLCVNAHDAMPRGGSLTMSNAVTPLTADQAAKFQLAYPAQFLRCTVRDTGAGIAPEILPRIFDPFFTTKAKGKGTGLGLAIVHSVVAKAGGFVEVESELGRGAAFHLYFPIAAEEVTRSAPPPRPKIKMGSGRVLVVDDLSLVHDFTRDFLQIAGYEVFVADSADAALAVLERERIDLLFTDYNMPHKNGWQLIQEVSSRWPRVKLVLVSGYLDDNERILVEKNHDVRLLNKPFSIGEATALIGELLDSSGPPSA